MRRTLTPFSVALMGLSAASASWAELKPVELDPVNVNATRSGPRYSANPSAATKTKTDVMDLAQSVSVVTAAQVQDQAQVSLSELLRYVPGASSAQGEGHRDAPILRGQTSTADLFVNGVRDDVQYFRDLYNVERVEVLQGPNAMIFGRGGIGGVINRVTKEADGRHHGEFSLQGGSFDHQRVQIDAGSALRDTGISGRLAAMYESSDSYRDDSHLERMAANPTVGVKLGKNTRAVVGHEILKDDRTTDRGGPSQNGRPFDGGNSRFYGDPNASNAETHINVSTLALTHRFADNLSLTNRLSYGDYNKFYDNVFASSAVRANGDFDVQGYQSTTLRNNLFNQTDVVWNTRTRGIDHTVLLGLEVGQQDTDNLRFTRRFDADGNAATAPVTTITANVAHSNFAAPLADLVQGGTADGNNKTRATVVGAYAQDQVALTSHLKAIVGLRFDRFAVDFTNRRTGVATGERELSTEDNLVSPRAGLIWQPTPSTSVYGAYSLSYLPRSGEQMGSLTPSNQSLKPEEFRNLEVGARWQPHPALTFSTALFDLQRKNVLLAPATASNPAVVGDGAETRGWELGVSGQPLRHWTINGGYALLDARLTQSVRNAAGVVDANNREGARLAQTPRHAFGLWNRYDFDATWGAGLGVIGRSGSFATTSNAVRLPGYARVDAAVYFAPAPAWAAQLNVENLLDTDYTISAHNDNNLMPGAPFTVKAAVRRLF